ncbi:RidA family protein [Nisaea sp.]|uniref:RidA family protein n=1 Tax=Nisaea sp. TaxID=2024842 RepID=UPI003263A65C
MANGFEVPEVWKARGRGFQMGVTQHEGVIVRLTGQVAWDADENIVGLGDVTLQTRQIFDNIGRLLAHVGGVPGDIVETTTYFTNRSQLPEIQKVRAAFFPEGREPVSTSVMVAGLGHEDFLVEITPVAVIPADRFRTP